MTPPYNLRMFDISGRPLDRFHATFNCSWAMNEWGTAEWEMACADEKASKRNFNFGRYVLFEHARLGKWGGVINPQEGMSGTWENKVVLHARSGEYQLSRRYAPLYDANNNSLGAVHGTAGQLARQLIYYANLPGDSLIRPGNIDDGGKETMLLLQDANLRDMMDILVRRTGYDWWMEPFLEYGNLRFALNFQERRGVDAGYVLRERVNIRKKGGDLWRRCGELVNDTRVVGGNGSIPLKARGEAVSRSSIDQYGVWQGYDTVESENPDIAQMRADEQVSQQGDLPYELMLEAIESRQSPDTFSYIGMGDTVTARIDTARFYGEQKGIHERCRILTREYNTKANACILTVEVLT